MNDWFYKNIDSISIVLGCLIIYTPIFHEVKEKDKKIFGLLPKPTFGGYLFVLFVIALFFVSYKKSIKDDNEKTIFQKHVMNELSRYDTILTRQLNKMGLTLKDTIIIPINTRSPNLTYTTNEVGIAYIQNKSTLHITVAIRNSGNGIAKNVTFKAYYLIIKPISKNENTAYEYYKPFLEHDTTEISPNEVLHTRDEDGMPFFKFDNKLNKQFILILGNYTDENLENPVRKEIKMCFMWNVNQGKWMICGDEKYIEGIHFDKRLSNTKFKTYPFN